MTKPALLLALISCASFAQTIPAPAPDTFTLQQLTEQGKALLEQARATTGSITKPLAQYHGHGAILNARTRSGGAEQHATFSDLFIVLAGEGTELTGGTIIDPKPNGNETRGARLEGATAHKLQAGDILHIAAGTPHQALEDPGQGIVLLVIKIEDGAR
jgi:mannose-6-phosphate isomerase-like protein (cupin superfamily)